MGKSKRRGGELIAILGHNNTGKSVTTQNIIESFNKERDNLAKNHPVNYYRLATFDVQGRFNNLKRKNDVAILPTNDDWCKQLLKLRCSLIVLDDYRILMDSDRMESDFLNLLQYRAEYGIDIIIITHNPSLLHERLTYYLNRYLLFYTTGKPESFKSKIPDYETLIKCKTEIDDYYKKYTPDEYKKIYPNFPFIEWNGVSQKAIKYNFK